jgi:hypothetical protein
MTELKVSLSFFVPGANMLSSQECDKNPKKNYNEDKMLIRLTRGKGKHRKEREKSLIIRTRKQKLAIQKLNICEEAYKYMLSTPTSVKLSRPTKRNKDGDVIKRVWDTMSIHERLKKHFDLLAHDFHAVSYSYEILDN